MQHVLLSLPKLLQHSHRQESQCLAQGSERSALTALAKLLLFILVCLLGEHRDLFQVSSGILNLNTLIINSTCKKKKLLKNKSCKYLIVETSLQNHFKNRTTSLFVKIQSLKTMTCFINEKKVITSNDQKVRIVLTCDSNFYLI